MRRASGVRLESSRLSVVKVRLGVRIVLVPFHDKNVKNVNTFARWDGSRHGAVDTVQGRVGCQIVAVVFEQLDFGRHKLPGFSQRVEPDGVEVRVGEAPNSVKRNSVQCSSSLLGG